MCIVIDKNTLANVFNKRDSKHFEFEPVYDWIINKRGKIIMGGSTYKKELRDSGSYLRLIRNLSTANKVFYSNDKEVDDYEEMIIEKINDPRCDDAHLIAILAISKCFLLCTNDMRSKKYLRNKEFYPPNARKTKFYTNQKSASILDDRNLVEDCKPYPILNKQQRVIIETSI